MKMYLVLGKYKYTKTGIDNLKNQLEVLNKSIPKQKSKMNLSIAVYEEDLEDYNMQITRNRKLHTNKYYYPANSSNVATARRVLGRIY